MKKGSGFGSGRGGTVLPVVGWVLIVALGIGLVWLGFTLDKRDRPPEVAQPLVAASATPVQATVWPTATPLPSATVPNTPTPTPTATPLPTATPEPTAIPATATPVVATIVAGADGVNVRSGPGTNYTRLGYLDPGAEAQVIGRYSDWWQIRYDDAPGWVFGEIVTASNADNVPQVEPPPAPTAAPATATPVSTAVPPTQAPADFRGLVPDKFEVEDAPGPYALGQEIWFHMWITNKTDTPVEYEYLGVQVEETGEVQKSWIYSEIAANEQFYHHDQMHDKISAPGTYNLWLVIRFRDGAAFRMLGPVTVIVQ